MHIGVISDTHGDKNAIIKAYEVLKEVDVIIHLGDNDRDAEELSKVYKNKIISVRGNCDFMSNTPIELFEEFNGVSIFITHGHKYDVKKGLLKLKERALELRAEIALYGHTHMSQIDFEEGIWFINPGSAALPRDGKSSVAIIEVEDGEVVPNIKNVEKDY